MQSLRAARQRQCAVYGAVRRSCLYACSLCFATVIHIMPYGMLLHGRRCTAFHSPAHGTLARAGRMSPGRSGELILGEHEDAYDR